MTNFSLNPEVNFGNILGELTPVKFMKLILTELGNDVKVIVQGEIKDHLENETPKPNQIVTDSCLKEINGIKCHNPGTWHDSSTVKITVAEFCKHRKRKKYCREC